MPATRIFNTVGVHAAGEVCDVVVGGVLDIPAKNMYEKMLHFWEKEDHLRQLLLNEPRGCSAMCHNIILPPCNPEADASRDLNLSNCVLSCCCSPLHINTLANHDSNYQANCTASHHHIRERNSLGHASLDFLIFFNLSEERLKLLQSPVLRIS